MSGCSQLFQEVRTIKTVKGYANTFCLSRQFHSSASGVRDHLAHGRQSILSQSCSKVSTEQSGSKVSETSTGTAAVWSLQPRETPVYLLKFLARCRCLLFNLVKTLCHRLTERTLLLLFCQLSIDARQLLEGSPVVINLTFAGLRGRVYLAHHCYELLHRTAVLLQSLLQSAVGIDEIVQRCLRLLYTGIPFSGIDRKFKN